MAIKIPLFKAKSLGFERDMATFSIKYGTLPTLFSTAIVDTGCPFVILSENVLGKTRIPYMSFPSLERPVSLGPVSMELKNLGECDIFFKDESGNTLEPPFKQTIYAGIPILGRNQKLNFELPSFIGKEFLDKHQLSIVKNRGGKSFICKIDI